MAKKEKILLIFLIGLGFFLRVFRLRELMGFDYDQEVAALAVKSILSGKLTLIGQEISIGGVFIGPIYYYLLSFVYWVFRMDPIGAGVMVAIFSISTMLLLFLLTKELFNKSTAFLALLIFATNSQINFYDRTTAPSNLVLPITLLILYLLLKIRQGNIKLFSFLALILSTSIIHFHPILISLIPLSAILWKYWRLPKPSNFQILASLFAIVIVASPLLLFDLRHNFLNTKGVLTALKQSSNEAYFFPLKLLITLRIQAQNFASLFPIKNFSLAIIILALLSFIKFSNKAQKYFISCWILIPAVVFSFYSRHIPEYYLLPSLPAFIIIIAVLIEKIYKEYNKILAVTVMLIFILPNIQKIVTSYNPFSLFYKQQAIEFINTNAGEKAYVSFDTDLGLNAGLLFLLQNKDIKIADNHNSPTHTIIMPSERRISPGDEFIFGGIKVIKSQSEFKEQ